MPGLIPIDLPPIALNGPVLWVLIFLIVIILGGTLYIIYRFFSTIDVNPKRMAFVMLATIFVPNIVITIGAAFKGLMGGVGDFSRIFTGFSVSWQPLLIVGLAIAILVEWASYEEGWDEGAQGH